MKHILSLMIVALLLGLMPALADEEVVIIPDRGLITAATPLPEIASDTRGDGIIRDETDRPATHELLGQSLFQFEAPRVGGGTFNSDSLRGKWTVMAFWGVWCHDSRNDAENIAAIAARFADHPDVQFMSLHVPYNREYLDKRFGKFSSVDAYFEDRGLKHSAHLAENPLDATLSCDWAGHDNRGLPH